MLEDKFNSIVNDKSYLEYRDDDYKAILALSFHSRIIENIYSIILLLKQGQLQSTANILLRSTLEASIDLDNLCNVDGYFDYLIYLAKKDQLKLINKPYSQKLMNGNLSEYYRRKNYRQKECKKLEKDLKKKYRGKFCKNTDENNHINESIHFKFKLAKSLDTYDSIYYLLCGILHNNLFSLEDSYMSNNFQVTPFKKIDSEEMDKICEVSTLLLDKSIESINKILKVI